MKLLKVAALAATLAGPALVAPAYADGSHTGQYGGTTTWDRDCYNGPNLGICHRERTYTTPGGNTWERGRTVYNGPGTYGRLGHTTGPYGGATGFVNVHGYRGAFFHYRGFRPRW
jgi:hypothetical protein